MFGNISEKRKKEIFLLKLFRRWKNYIRYQPKKSFRISLKIYSILRVKKGQILTETPTNTCIWMKDKVYLDGFTKISKANLSELELQKLKKGKIKLEDQSFIV